MSRHTLFAALLGLGWLVRAAAFAHAAESAPDTSATTHATRGAGTDLSGTVCDLLSGAPLSTAEVAVLSGPRLVPRRFTAAFGQHAFHTLPPGKSLVQARLRGY